MTFSFEGVWAHTFYAGYFVDECVGSSSAEPRPGAFAALCRLAEIPLYGALWLRRRLS